MCLATPGQIIEITDTRSAIVDILGVRRKVNTELLGEDPPHVGDWILVHVGFALNKISPQMADEQLQMLMALGEASSNQEEVVDTGDSDTSFSRSTEK